MESPGASSLGPSKGSGIPLKGLSPEGARELFKDIERFGPIAHDWLVAQAGRLRDATHGHIITYSPKVFFPVTKLCRNRCHYCTFARPPKHWGAFLMQESAALDLARRGLSFGCSEALLTLGEKPEERYPVYKRMLEDLGFRSTNAYVAHLSRRIFEESGLYPHVNVGVMDEEDFELLSPTSLSMGLMLENASERFLSPKMPHAKSPGKAPKERLRTLERAGELGIAFTTGILVGIGETLEERLEALLAIQDIQARFGHIQEVIIQNFLPKPRTPMAKASPPSHEEMVLTIALARVVLGGDMNIQAPPNLALGPLEDYLRAGINDLGGISPLTQDFINPEAPWPHIESLGLELSKDGFSLKPRLPLYREFFSRAFVRPLFRASLSMDENGAQEYGKRLLKHARAYKG